MTRHRGTASRIRLLLVLSTVAGTLLAGIVFPFVGGLGLAAGAAARSFNNLPSNLSDDPLAQRSQLLAADGSLLAQLVGPENRVVVPIEQVAITMQKAIVAIEDSRFYSHHGIDYHGLLRALVKNSQSGGVTQGGSTLTQQYIKNLLIEQAHTPAERRAATERTTGRKLKEARYALAIEKKFTKQEILGRYLNIAYFGNGIYGVGTAAEQYFGVPASQLSLPQAALLAGLVNSPTEFDPIRHPKAAKERRDTVLNRMKDLRFISAHDANVALMSRVVVHLSQRSIDACETSSAPFYCDYVRSQLLNDPAFGDTADQRRQHLFQGGVTIRSTLDPVVQKAAQTAVDSTIDRTNRVATAVAVIRPGTGEVLAMAINRSYGASKMVGFTKVNYTVVDNAFSPGSTFKLFTLTAAIQAGIPLSTKIYAPACYVSALYPIARRTNGSSCPDGFANAGDSEAGTFDIPSATWNSVNTFFIQLEERVGLQKVAAMARLLGVRTKSLLDPSQYGGTLTIGGTTASPLDMANAYATIAARGLRCDPHAVTSITDTQAHPVAFTPPAACQQVIESGIADTVTSVLQGVITHGTGFPNADIGRPAAGKTGTAENYSAAWFVGYVPQLAAGVWVGDPRGGPAYPLKNVTADGRFYDHVFGGDLGAIVWARTMRAALLGVPVQDFVNPDPSIAGGKQVDVPDVSGLSLVDAGHTLNAVGFHVVVSKTRLAAGPIADGVVASTSPAGGTQAPEGATVTIYLSDGTLPGTEPSPTPPVIPRTTPNPSTQPNPSPSSSSRPSPTPAGNAQ